MNTDLFQAFAPVIRTFNGDASAPDLLLGRDGPLAAYYAPFDWLNPHAKVVLVGITPGRTQATNALAEAKAQLLRGASVAEALIAGKRTGAFSGAMRPNLVAMLDHIGLAKWLGIRSCDELFGLEGRHAHLLQSTSAMPFPVFVNGENYSASPDIVTTPFLRKQVLQHFTPLFSAMPDAVFLPLGPVPTKALSYLVSEGYAPATRVLSGLPHPSGANAERIQYFLGNKPRSLLSAKTDPQKLDAALASLRSAVASLS